MTADIEDIKGMAWGVISFPHNGDHATVYQSFPTYEEAMEFNLSMPWPKTTRVAIVRVTEAVRMRDQYVKHSRKALQAFPAHHF